MSSALRSRLGSLLAHRPARHAIVGVLLALVVGTPITAAVAANPTLSRQKAPTAMSASTGAAGPSAAPRMNASLASVAVLPDLPIAAIQNSRLPGSIPDDRRLLLGGVGSDLWRSPSDPPGEFWMVTDRGPNGEVKVDGENRRTFPVPEYTPHILRVRVQGESVEVLETVPIVGRSGQPVTGLPNAAGDEPPYDVTGQTRLPMNPSGLDVEGLVRTASGDFWAVEEYGPSLVHIDRNGAVLRRFVPQGLQIQGADYPIVASLPEIVRLRTPNRGFEGLTLSPDGGTLYLALQGPLSNPDEKTANGSRVARILAFDIAGERVTAEYAYPLGWLNEKKVAKQQAAAAKPERAAKPGKAEKPEKPAKPDTVQTRVSALAPVGSTQLLVLERTGEDARLYLVNLDDADNLLGTRWDDPQTAPSLEAVANPADEGVAMLSRMPIADLTTIPGLPEKIEGIAILDATTVAIANDNDFDLGDLDHHGNNVGEGIKSQILTVTLPAPLPYPGDQPVSLRLSLPGAE
jgi:hypothetical protein